MINYEILSHPADLKIKVFGRTKEELFSNALLSMMEAKKPELNKDPKIKNRKIKIKSADIELLLVDFLSEVLYLSQINKEAYIQVQFKKFSDFELTGLLKGKKAERFGEDIKAVTHHDLEIKQNLDSTWEATVLFDI